MGPVEGRRLWHTCARVTPFLDPLMLAPDDQMAALALASVDGAEPMAGRALRGIAHAGTWSKQRAAWALLATPRVGSIRL